jgi:predicted GNAT family acetyltransferase
LRFWVGYLDDRPVACAGAHVTEVCVDVEYVATHADVRGRGFGAAVTWAATLADPAKPAVLIASDPGQPVYERMGYLRLMRLTMWGGS